MDIRERNKQVKAVLADAFGRKNVSVTNGKGTAWGWCHIDIELPAELGTTEIVDGDRFPKYTRQAKDLMNDCYNLVNFLIKGIKFYSYTDDMNSDHSEVLVQCSFKS